MQQNEQLMYLLGYIKASIEHIAYLAFEEGSFKSLNSLTDLEQYLNKEMKKIFSV